MSAAAPPPVVDPQILATAAAALERLREDLRLKETDLHQANTRLDEANQATKQLISAKPRGRTTYMAAMNEAKRVIHSYTGIVVPDRATYEQVVSLLEQAIPPLQEAVREANNRVEVQKQAVTRQTEHILFLNGNRIPAVDYFRKPFQECIKSPVETGSSPAALSRKTVIHHLPRKVRKWVAFNPELNLIPLLQDKTVNNYKEAVLDKKRFGDERQFEAYLTLPQVHMIKAIEECFPKCGAEDFTIESNNDELVGSPDMNYCTYQGDATTQPIRVSHAVFEFKRPQLKMTETHAVDVIEAMKVGKVTDDIGAAHMTVFEGCIQTFTYMVGGTRKCDTYGCLTNWDSSIFMKRVVELNNDTGEMEEVLLISDWFGLNKVRMAHAYFFYLMACEYKNGDAIPPRAKMDGLPRHITCTEDALGISPLMFVTPYQILTRTEKAHTRLVEVPGLGKLVCKFVDYLGTPKYTKWKEDMLIDLEEREIAAYKHLQHLQGVVIPRFIFNGSDFNFFFVTVTSWEGVSLQHVVDTQGYLSLDIRLCAMAALRRIHDAGTKVLADVLAQNCSLTQVNLCGNKIGDVGAIALAEALTQNNSLTELLLAHNQIGDEGTKALADALVRNCTLTKLNLYDNRIGRDGAKALADVLAGNGTLMILALDSNAIGDDGVKFLADSLARNDSLRELGLVGCQIGYEGGKALADALDVNYALHMVRFWDNKESFSSSSLPSRMYAAVAANNNVTLQAKKKEVFEQHVLWLSGKVAGKEV